MSKLENLTTEMAMDFGRLDRELKACWQHMLTLGTMEDIHRVEMFFNRVKEMEKKVDELFKKVDTFDSRIEKAQDDLLTLEDRIDNFDFNFEITQNLEQSEMKLREDLISYEEIEGVVRDKLRNIFQDLPESSE
tara:strand:- start:736 stop:1137 length:402 start_codon:yes stop_codon:yes gene_type:complete